MKRKKKREYSKIVCGILVGYGILCGIFYYVAVFLDKSVDATLAVQCVITVIGAYMSYLLYQFGLKNSRNKYGVDSEGQPYKIKNEENHYDG